MQSGQNQTKFWQNRWFWNQTCRMCQIPHYWISLSGTKMLTNMYDAIHIRIYSEVCTESLKLSLHYALACNALVLRRIFHGMAMAMPLQCNCAAVAPPRYCHGIAMACQSTAMALSWDCHGIALALPWHSHGIPMALPWRCHGTVPLQSHTVMAMPYHCHGNAMGLPWCCRALPWQCHGTAWHAMATTGQPCRWRESTMAVLCRCHGTASPSQCHFWCKEGFLRDTHSGPGPRPVRSQTSETLLWLKLLWTCSAVQINSDRFKWIQIDIYLLYIDLDGFVLIYMHFDLFILDSSKWPDKVGETFLKRLHLLLKNVSSTLSNTLSPHPTLWRRPVEAADVVDSTMVEGQIHG